jgi:hypothetical protein
MVRGDRPAYGIVIILTTPSLNMSENINARNSKPKKCPWMHGTNVRGYPILIASLHLKRFGRHGITNLFLLLRSMTCIEDSVDNGLRKLEERG